MAPFDLANNVFVSILIGLAFGFTLESSGFGDTRRLAAQFYLTDMRVLKVMFTGIVVAMLLIFLGDRFGIIDFDKLYVPVTFTWPGLVGGLLLGVGFVVGGFCPGTSLVASATLKVDGMLFVGGLAFGTFLFHETIESFLSFWTVESARGRATLMDDLGLSTGAVVLAVVVMALVAFRLAHASERHFGSGGKGAA